MSTDNNSIPVTVLGKLYQIKCPRDKANDLQESALYLDRKMREVSESNKVVGFDQVAVLTSLNICYELLAQQKQNTLYIDAMNKQIRDLQKKVENTLTQSQQMELE